MTEINIPSAITIHYICKQGHRVFSNLQSSVIPSQLEFNEIKFRKKKTVKKVKIQSQESTTRQSAKAK
jgi:hypothetical protein